MELPYQPATKPSRAARSRIANALFAAAALFLGISAPLSPSAFFCCFILALAAIVINREPLLPRLQTLPLRWLLPWSVPFGLLLLLGIYHSVSHPDHLALVATAAAALLLPLLLASSIIREPRNLVYLAQGLFLGTLFACLFRQPIGPTYAAFTFLTIALLLEIILLIPSLSWRLTAALAAQAAILFTCFAALDFWPALLLLPFAIAPTLANIIAKIPYSIGRLSVWVGIAFIWLFSISYFAHIADTYFTGHQQSKKSLPALTHNGNPYLHDTLSHDKENGYYVNIFVCPSEIDSQWPTVSNIPLNTITPSGQVLRDVLIRYLTSLDLHKDSVGISQLSPRDVKAIERGVYNATLNGKSFIFKSAWHELEYFDRYFQTKHPSSLLTAISDQSAKARVALSSAPALGRGLRYTRSNYPLAIGFFSLPLAIGSVPTLLLFALLAAAAIIALLSPKRTSKRAPLRYLGLTALAVAVAGTLCASTLLTPAFASLFTLLLALSLASSGD